MMTRDQRASWDFKVTLAKACRDERPIPPDGDFETHLSDDLMIAADDELAELRAQDENLRVTMFGLLAASGVSFLVGCGFGWLFNSLTGLGYIGSRS